MEPSEHDFPTPPEAADTRSPAVDGDLTSAGAWFSIRPMQPSDVSLVMESWLGTWKTARAAGCIPNNLFDQVQTALIDQLLVRGMHIDVITPSNRPSQVMGWIAYEPDPKSPGKSIIHYVFTKAPFRRRGIAATLIARVGNGDGRFVYTHETSFARYWPRAFHMPALARQKELKKHD